MNLGADKKLIRDILSAAGDFPFPVIVGENLTIYPGSVCALGKRCRMLIVEDMGKKYLLQFSSSSPPSFIGNPKEMAIKIWDSIKVSILPITPALVSELSESYLSWAKPQPIGNSKPSFGWGNRTNFSSQVVLETFAQWKHTSKFGLVIAQNSVRENEILGRLSGFKDVMAEATLAKIMLGYKGITGSDADHLKTRDEIDEAIKAGFTGYTLDPSSVLAITPKVFKRGKERTLAELANDPQLDRLYTDTTKRNRLSGYLKRSKELLRSRFSNLSSGDLKQDERIIKAVAVKFGDCLSFIRKGYNQIKKGLGGSKFDFEASFDETATPTDHIAHLLIVNELVTKGVKLTRFAVKYVGRFEKTTDYIGDIGKFRADYNQHQEIAKFLGHIQSIHSGSGKYSIYPYVPKAHLKTSGDISRPMIVALAEADFELYCSLHPQMIKSAKETKRLYGAVSSPYNNFNTLPKDVKKLGQKKVAWLLREDVVWRTMSHYAYGIFKSAEGLFAYSLFHHPHAYWRNVAEVICAHRDPIYRANKGI